QHGGQRQVPGELWFHLLTALRSIGRGQQAAAARQGHGADNRHQQENRSDLEREQVTREQRGANRVRQARVGSARRRQNARLLHRNQNESNFGNQYRSQSDCDRQQKLQPRTAVLLLLDVQQHDHEDDQHHDRAGVNDHLHGSDERRRQQYVKARQRDEHANQRDRAVERIALRHHRQRAADRHCPEKYEQKRQHRTKT